MKKPGKVARRRSVEAEKCTFPHIIMLFMFFRTARFNRISKRLTSPKVKHLPSEKHDFFSRGVPGCAGMQVISMFFKRASSQPQIIKSHPR